MKSFREFCEYLHRIEYQQEFDWARTEEIAVRLVAQYEGRLVNSEVSVTPRQGTSYITALYVAWRMCYDPCDMIVVHPTGRESRGFSELVYDIMTRQAITQIAPRQEVTKSYWHSLEVGSNRVLCNPIGSSLTEHRSSHNISILPCELDEYQEGWLLETLDMRKDYTNTPSLRIKRK